MLSQDTIHRFEATLRAQGYQEITTVTRDAEYALGEHEHPFDACALILEGGITLKVAGKDTHYAAGEVFTLPRQTPHHEWTLANGVKYLAGRRT